MTMDSDQVPDNGSEPKKIKQNRTKTIKATVVADASAQTKPIASLNFTRTDLKSLYQLALEANHADSASENNELPSIQDNERHTQQAEAALSSTADTLSLLPNEPVPERILPKVIEVTQTNIPTLAFADNSVQAHLLSDAPRKETSKKSKQATKTIAAVTPKQTLDPLTQLIHNYNVWKLAVLKDVELYKRWLSNRPIDKEKNALLNKAINLFVVDRVRIAIVGEFSRGKSEFINALLAQPGKQRLFPTRVGRTTMCPVEIYSDIDTPTYLKLLPIQTRETQQSVGFYRSKPEMWFHHDLDLDNPDAMKQVLREVARTIEVKDSEAQQLGFNLEYLEASIGKAGYVHVPAWRHALINYRHPLLDAGVSIVDTPGINAPGLETDLTADVLADAQGILYLLSVETGVTASDFAMWHKTIAPVARDFQIALMGVLNKIDLLEDDEEPIIKSIERIIRMTAKQLKIAQRQIIPVSAKYALKSGLEGDELGLKRSGLAGLTLRIIKQVLKTRQQLLKHVVLKKLQQAVSDSNANMGVVEVNDAATSILAHHENVISIDNLEEQRASLAKAEIQLKEALKLINKFRAPFNAMNQAVDLYISQSRYASHRKNAAALLLQADIQEELAVKNAMGTMLSMLKADMLKMGSQIAAKNHGLDELMNKMGLNFTAVPTQSIDDMNLLIQGLELRYCKPDGVTPIRLITDAETEFFPKIDWLFNHFITSLNAHREKVESALEKIKERYQSREQSLRQMLEVHVSTAYTNKEEDKLLLDGLLMRLKQHLETE